MKAKSDEGVKSSERLLKFYNKIKIKFVSFRFHDIMEDFLESNENKIKFSF